MTKKMKGIIKDINWDKGMVGVETKNDGFTIFQILADDNLHLRDELTWDEDHPFGHADIKNLTTDEQFEVFFENHNVGTDNLKRLLLY